MERITDAELTQWETQKLTGGKAIRGFDDERILRLIENLRAARQEISEVVRENLICRNALNLTLQCETCGPIVSEMIAAARAKTGD